MGGVECPNFLNPGPPPSPRTSFALPVSKVQLCNKMKFLLAFFDWHSWPFLGMIDELGTIISAFSMLIPWQKLWNGGVLSIPRLPGYYPASLFYSSKQAQFMILTISHLIFYRIICQQHSLHLVSVVALSSLPVSVLCPSV